MTIGSQVLRTVLLLVSTVGALFAVTAPARADLRVCNESANLVSVALGYRAERGWQSEGWWQAPPGECRVLYQGDLPGRYYYIYAADDVGGGEWNGTYFMCTRDESFTIFGVEDCLARGYERTGFFEIDTQERTDWTLQLTEPGQSSGPIGPEGLEEEEPLLLLDPETGEQTVPQ
jgi:uncharacterized membrane protein